MRWLDLLQHEQFQHLFQDSPLTEYLTRIDRQLVDPTMSHDKTLVLRGERAGILRVIVLVEELAERESEPLDPAETEEERDAQRVERILGYRPVFRPKRRTLVRTGGVA